MAIATTSAVWRSTGGDTTRTAQAGSMVMVTPFYIANAAATANVTNISGGEALVLPAGAIVTDVLITSTGANTIDMGFTPLVGVGPGQTTTLGTNVRTGIFSGRSVAARAAVTVAGTGAGAFLGNVANATNLVVITAQSNASASGTVSGLIKYTVYDAGVENV
jgi:hypothetical protein